MTRATKYGYVFQLRCTLGHTFMLTVERENDLAESFLSDTLDKQTGFVIYRDRSFVECGYCRAFCHFTGVKAEIEVNQKQDGV